MFLRYKYANLRITMYIKYRGSPVIVIILGPVMGGASVSGKRLDNFYTPDRCGEGVSVNRTEYKAPETRNFGTVNTPGI